MVSGMELCRHLYHHFIISRIRIYLPLIENITDPTTNTSLLHLYCVKVSYEETSKSNIFVASIDAYISDRVLGLSTISSFTKSQFKAVSVSNFIQPFPGVELNVIIGSQWFPIRPSSFWQFLLQLFR